MTWTLSSTDLIGVTRSVVLPDPEVAEAWTRSRRQNRVDTDGGQSFTQDLGVEDQFLEATWVNLNQEESSGIQQVLRGARYQVRDIAIVVDGIRAFLVEIGTGTRLCGGEEIGTGQGLGTGQLIQAEGFTINGARLDQPDTVFEGQFARNSAALRFRLIGERIS